MRPLLALAIIGASTLLAQRVPTISATQSPMQPPAGAYRFGNILFPGGIAPHQRMHASRVGSIVNGVGVGPQFPNQRFPDHRNRTITVPYAYPVYFGDPYGGYGYQQQQIPNVTVVVPQQPTPQVIINHNYTPETAKPVLRDYSESKAPAESGIKVYEGPKTPETARRIESDDKPTIYLVAFKDGNIRQAIGYWIQGDEFSYVTPQSKINRVALDTLDRELSERLNSERNLEFDLNSARRQ